MLGIVLNVESSTPAAAVWRVGFPEISAFKDCRRSIGSPSNRVNPVKLAPAANADHDTSASDTSTAGESLRSDAIFALSGDVAKKARGSCPAVPDRTNTSMATPDTLRYASIPLVHGPGVIPAVGFGTLIQDPLAARQASKTALEVGYRHLDCAERYRTEEAVGEAMQESFRAGTIRRLDVFVTTKLWITNHRPERVKPAFDASRRRLQIDHVDCYMIHTPFAFRPGDDQDPADGRGQVLYDSGVTLLETWQALERLVDEGQCRSIGLSDVTLEMLQEIFAAARIKPASVQVECHPYFPQWDLIDFCREQGIVVQAGAPLAHASSPRIVDDPVIQAIAQDACSGCARLGRATRNCGPDQLDQTRSYPRILRFRPCLKRPCGRFGTT